MIYLYALAAAFVVVMILVPAVRAAAIRTGFVDRPTKRKIHSQPIPLSGGVAIFAGVIISSYLFLGNLPLFRTILIGGASLVVIGLVDDAYKSRPRNFGRRGAPVV